MQTYPLHFFGPGTVIDAHGQPVALRSRKQLAMLAYLAVEYPITHHREILQAFFWSQKPTATVQNNLRVILSRLREIAGKIGQHGTPVVDLLVTDRNHVQLHPAWVERVDVNHFNQLLQRTRQHAHASPSQCAACQPLLQQAVTLYQGEFLAGLGLADCPEFEEWLLMQRERLKLLVGEAHHDLAVFAESQRDWISARTHALRQIELDPLREPAYRQLMRVLAQLGERSAALATFERCRRVLNEELGLDPEPETLALHGQLLHASALDEHQPAELGVQPAKATPPLTNLPRQLTPFIGREQEIEQLQARLADPTYRLLSLVGPGGIGKSRLAQQVAVQQLDRFSDGVYFVPLAQVQTVESIPAVIAETVGLSFVASQKQPAEQLVEMLHAKHLLLVLDNFEHLMAGVDLFIELLQHAPKVVLLVTTRERLNLQAEDIFELQGLPTPTDSSEPNASTYAAVRLFVDRAHRLDKNFRLTAEQLPAVVRICQLVEGFPLAIELAATWVCDLTCQEIVKELAEGLDLLETTLRDIDPQHRSLRAVFNSSWRLLSAVERRTLARLAVFRGGFTLDAARTIADASPMLISGLRNKSLLRHAGSRRYDMHALVQQFSAEALESDAAAATQARRLHSQYFLTLLSDQAIALDTRAAGVAGALIQPDWENIVIAWQHATALMDIPLLQRALEGLHRFCELRGLYLEAQTLFESTMARLEMVHTSFTKTREKEDGEREQDEKAEGPEDEMQRTRLHCHLLTALIYVAECRYQYERTQELTKRALAIAAKLEGNVERIHIYVAQAATFEVVGDFTQGMALAEKMLGLAQAEGLEIQAGICMELIGFYAYRLGDYVRSNEMYQRLLAFHEQSDRLGIYARLAMLILGSMAIDQGHYEMGLTHFQRLLASSQATDDRVNRAHAYACLARAWNHLGDYEQAIAMAEQSIVQSDLIGHAQIKCLALLSKGYAQRQLGELTGALRTHSDAVTLAHRSGSPTKFAHALTQLAETQMALAQSKLAESIHERDEAATNFAEAATHLRAADERIKAYEAEIGLAELAYRRAALAEACQQITPIVPHLPTLSAEGWDEPIRAYGVCTEILRAANDPRAELIHRQGLQLLDSLAQRITEPTLRRNFLHVIPAHRTLRTL